jgi:hypothetical protein
MQKTTDFCMGSDGSAGVRFVRASGAPDAEVFCIARPLCRDARTPRHRVRLEPASRGVLRAHTRAGVAGADAGGGFCWLRRAGPQARQCAKLLTRRRICRCGDHAVRGAPSGRASLPRHSTTFEGSCPWVLAGFPAAEPRLLSCGPAGEPQSASMPHVACACACVLTSSRPRQAQ